MHEELGQDRESTGEKGFKTKPLRKPQDSEAVQRNLVADKGGREGDG